MFFTFIYSPFIFRFTQNSLTKPPPSPTTTIDHLTTTLTNVLDCQPLPLPIDLYFFNLNFFFNNYYIYAWEIRKCGKVVENMFSIAFSKDIFTYRTKHSLNLISWNYVTFLGFYLLIWWWNALETNIKLIFHQGSYSSR